MSVYGYVRVSNLSQADLSPEQQRHEIISHLSRNNLGDPVAIFEDIGVSGMRTDERRGYQQLLAALKPGDAVIVLDVSRIGRRAQEVLRALDWFKEQGIRFISIRQNLDSSTVAGALVYGILAVVGEMMVAEARQRTQLAIDYLKKRGMKTGGSVPFGFDAVETPEGKKLVANAEEHAAIITAVRLRASGMSLRAIAKALEASGVPSRGSTRWHHGSVRSLLQRHCGEAPNGGVLLESKEHKK